MERIISEKFGCKIIERKNRIFIQYDNGESASWMVENEITLEEAKIATESEQNACKIILKAQRREGPQRVY